MLKEEDLKDFEKTLKEIREKNIEINEKAYTELSKRFFEKIKKIDSFKKDLLLIKLFSICAKKHFLNLETFDSEFFNLVKE